MADAIENDPDQVLQGMARAEAEAARTYALAVLTGEVPTRHPVAYASRHMVTSVWVQAGLLGLVACSRCGDLGCDWCQGWEA